MGCGGYRNGYITMAMFLSFILFYFILINHYSYSDYLAYDGRPHLHVGIPTSKPVSAPHPLVTYRRREKTKQKTIGNKTIQNRFKENCHRRTPSLVLVLFHSTYIRRSCIQHITCETDLQFGLVLQSGCETEINIVAMIANFTLSFDGTVDGPFRFFSFPDSVALARQILCGQPTTFRWV